MKLLHDQLFVGIIIGILLSIGYFALCAGDYLYSVFMGCLAVILLWINIE